MRRGDTHLEPIGNDKRAAGNGRAVAAGLADDRRRLAGDRRLVDRGDAFDHLAVGGDDVAGLHQHDLTWAKLVGRRGHDKPSPLIDDELGLGLLAGLAQARGLRLAAALRPRLRRSWQTKR